jgi:hypothetical protein
LRSSQVIGRFVDAPEFSDPQEAFDLPCFHAMILGGMLIHFVNNGYSK